MKKIIAALILSGYVFTAQAGNVQVKSCDASVIVGMDDQPVQTLAFKPKFAVVADNGKSFTVVQGNNVLTSPALTQVKPGIRRAVNREGIIYIKRGGSYQISQDATTWLYYDGCVKP